MKHVLFKVLLVTLLLVTATVTLAAEFDASTFIYLGPGGGGYNDAQTLDPGLAYDTKSASMICQCYDHLIAYKDGSLSEFTPMLAAEVPSRKNKLISRDGLSYTFPIRRGIKFHNNALLTPEDVEYSFERNLLGDPVDGPMWILLEPLLGVTSIEEYACKLAKVDSFDKVDPENLARTAQAVMSTIEVKGNNVVFHLAKPFAPFLSILVRDYSWGAILNKKWMIQNGAWDGKVENWTNWHNLAAEKMTLNDQIMGTGPYKLKWDKENSIYTFTAFKDYFRGKARIKTAIYNNSITDFETRKNKLLQGEADAIFTPVENLPEINSLNNVTILNNLPFLMNYAMTFNQTINTQNNEFTGSGQLDGQGVPSDFFSDLNIRKAFCYAFDYDSYIRQAYSGNAGIPYGPILIPLADFFNTKMERFSFDPRMASVYFQKAFNGAVWEKGFKLTLVWNTPNVYRKMADEFLKKGIESLNPKFKIEVQGMDWKEMATASKAGKLPLPFTGWKCEYADPHNFCYAYLHSNGYITQLAGEAGIALAKKEFDALIDNGILTADLKERISIYSSIQEKAFQLAPHLHYGEQAETRVMRDWVKGFVWDPQRAAVYDFYQLYKKK